MAVILLHACLLCTMLPRGLDGQLYAYPPTSIGHAILCLQLKDALSLGSVEFFSKYVMYIAHEQLWAYFGSSH